MARLESLQPTSLWTALRARFAHAKSLLAILFNYRPPGSWPEYFLLTFVKAVAYSCECPLHSTVISLFNRIGAHRIKHTYNAKRLHSTLGYKTPLDYEKKLNKVSGNS